MTPRPAPRRRRVLAHAAMELRLQWRNAENLLVVLLIPAGLLVFFSLVDVLPRPAGTSAVAFLLPGVLALAVMAAGLVSLAIATGFERSYLVLKRLGATPLRRADLVAAKSLAVLATEGVQVVVLVAVAAALGWRPPAGGVAWAALPALLLGTAAFAGVGLALAGRLRALTTLAVVNAAFVLLLLISGIVFPLAVLPGSVRVLASLLPAAPLADWFRAALSGAGLPVASAVVLPLWAVAAPLLAARLFRWE